MTSMRSIYLRAPGLNSPIEFSECLCWFLCGCLVCPRTYFAFARDFCWCFCEHKACTQTNFAFAESCSKFLRARGLHLRILRYLTGGGLNKANWVYKLTWYRMFKHIRAMFKKFLRIYLERDQYYVCKNWLLKCFSLLYLFRIISRLFYILFSV